MADTTSECGFEWDTDRAPQYTEIIDHHQCLAEGEHSTHRCRCGERLDTGGAG